MTDQEKELKRFACRSLKTLSNWNEWTDAYNQQLDDHAKAGAFGNPIEHKDLLPKQQRQICRLQRTNVVKTSGKRKCRAYVDGSPRAAPRLREDVPAYASCIDQPGMKLFFALAVREGMSVTFADTTNCLLLSRRELTTSVLRITICGLSHYSVILLWYIGNTELNHKGWWFFSKHGVPYKSNTLTIS